MLLLHRLLSVWFQHVLKWPSVMYAVLRTNKRACMDCKVFFKFLLITVAGRYSVC